MAPHPVAKDKSLAMIGLSWLADLPASEVGEEVRGEGKGNLMTYCNHLTLSPV